MRKKWQKHYLSGMATIKEHDSSPCDLEHCEICQMRKKRDYNNTLPDRLSDERYMQMFARPSLYHCKFCDSTLPNRESYQIHLHTKDHLVEVGKQVGSELKLTSITVDKEQFSCNLCNMIFYSFNEMSQHANSNSHNKKLGGLVIDQTLRSPEPTPEDTEVLEFSTSSSAFPVAVLDLVEETKQVTAPKSLAVKDDESKEAQEEAVTESSFAREIRLIREKEDRCVSAFADQEIVDPVADKIEQAHRKEKAIIQKVKVSHVNQLQILDAVVKNNDLQLIKSAIDCPTAGVGYVTPIPESRSYQINVSPIHDTPRPYSTHEVIATDNQPARFVDDKSVKPYAVYDRIKNKAKDLKIRMIPTLDQLKQSGKNVKDLAVSHKKPILGTIGVAMLAIGAYKIYKSKYSKESIPECLPECLHNHGCKYDIQHLNKTLTDVNLQPTLPVLNTIIADTVCSKNAKCNAVDCIHWSSCPRFDRKLAIEKFKSLKRNPLQRFTDWCLGFKPDGSHIELDPEWVPLTKEELPIHNTTGLQHPLGNNSVSLDEFKKKFEDHSINLNELKDAIKSIENKIIERDGKTGKERKKIKKHQAHAAAARHPNVRPGGRRDEGNYNDEEDYFSKEEERRRQEEEDDEHARTHGWDKDDADYYGKNTEADTKLCWKCSSPDHVFKDCKFNSICKFYPNCTKDCKYKHPKYRKKMEHLRVNRAVVAPPILYPVKAQVGALEQIVNAFPAWSGLIVPRHGVAGASHVEVLCGGKWFPLDKTCVLNRHMTDQVIYKFPQGMPTLCNKSRYYRDPVAGESATLFWVDSAGKMALSTGPVGAERFIGTDNKLRVFSFDGSSVSGSCGGVYIANKDNGVIGFHGLGSTSVNVMPDFYPCHKSWDEDLIKFQQSKGTFEPIVDLKYVENYKGYINNRETLAIDIDIPQGNVNGRQL